jgi:hypothetical protein
MAESDPRAGGVERLDQLLHSFASGGYRAEGVEQADVGPGHDGHGGHGGHGGSSVRVFEHRGHRVEIVTRYEVTIDGQRWDQPMEVLGDGSVVYHGLPQYLVPSAVDMVRAVIDYSYEAPEEIRAAVRAAREEA